MRKLLFLILFTPLVLFGQSANDLILTQRNSAGTGNVQRNVGIGTAGQVMTSQGAGLPPVFSTVAGTGDVLANGTLTLNSLMIGQGSTTIAATTTGTGILTWLGTPSFTNLNAALTGDDVPGLAATNIFTSTNSFPTIRAQGSGGLVLESLNGTDVALIGPGNAAVMTLYGNLGLYSAASVSQASAGQLAFDSDAWAASRGALQAYDGTASTYVVAALASDTPSNGQVPTWNTGGTVTWETPSGSANAVTAASAAASSGLFWVSAGADRTATATDTVTTANLTTANVTTLRVMDNVNQSHGLSFVVASDLSANKTFTYTGAFNFGMTMTADTSVTYPTTGTLATLAGSETLTNKQVQLTAAHGTDDTLTGTTIAGLNAGATIAQWETVYLGGSSTWLLADANGSGTFPASGLAVAAYSSTNPAVILVRGTVRNDAWNWTPGGRLYLSTTAGGLTQTAPSTSGDKVQDVGFALTADIAYVDFNGVYLTVQ